MSLRKRSNENQVFFYPISSFWLEKNKWEDFSVEKMIWKDTRTTQIKREIKAEDVFSRLSIVHGAQDTTLYLRNTGDF